MFVQRNKRHFRVLADDLHLVPLQRAGIHPESVLHQIFRRKHLADTAGGGITLLHRDNFFDVLNVTGKRFEFMEKRRVFCQEVFREIDQIAWHQLSLGIVSEKRHEILRIFSHQRRCLG